MATNDKPIPTPAAPKAPSLSDTNARDQFISVALREIVSYQIANKKWNYDEAAAHSVRYANAVMAQRGLETAPLKLVVAKGMVGKEQIIEIDENGKVSGPLPSGPLRDAGQPSKSIAEIIGEAEPVEEVK